MNTLPCNRATVPVSLIQTGKIITCTVSSATVRIQRLDGENGRGGCVRIGVGVRLSGRRCLSFVGVAKEDEGYYNGY